MQRAALQSLSAAVRTVEWLWNLSDAVLPEGVSRSSSQIAD